MSDVIEVRNKIISHAPTETYRKGYEAINWHREDKDTAEPPTEGQAPVEGDSECCGQTCCFGTPPPASDVFRQISGQ